MRRPLVAGNWKMNLDLAQARELVADIRSRLVDLGADARKVEIAICPPAMYLFPAAKYVEGSEIKLGAQNIYYEPKGAFTGEVSAAMVAESGARYVILGHSERRHTIGHLEDDRMINRKVKATIAAGMTPILCVGETSAERDDEQTFEVLTFQLRAGLIGVELESADQLVIAYEPVWAIGTGKTASPAQAEEVHVAIRKMIEEKYDADVAQAVRIQYGGSVNGDNAVELLGQENIDGALVGGASLTVEKFMAIIGKVA